MSVLSCDTLDDYLTTYGQLLADQAQQSLSPLHVPGRDTPSRVKLLRQSFVPQAHVVAAAVKALAENDAIMLVCECGTGKTQMGMATVHARHEKHSFRYRALVFCPPQLVGKWRREIEETIPHAVTHALKSYHQLTDLDRSEKPTCPEWWVVSETMAKEGANWQPAYVMRRLPPVKKSQYDSINEAESDEDFESESAEKSNAGLEKIPCCPQCFRPITTTKDIPLPIEELSKRKLTCVGSDEFPGCGSPLWQYNADNRKWAPATYIHQHLQGYFDDLIVDEIHEENSPTSARATAMGTLAASVSKVIGLTGTLLGGYAWHMRTLLFRLSPTSLVDDGFAWSQSTKFDEVYGRIETRVTEKEPLAAADNRRSRGSATRTKKAVPGIMPTLFGRHLIDKCIFLSLDELSDDLPPFEERTISVPMDSEMASAYKHTEDALTVAIKQMMAKNDRRLLGAMLNCLLTYPDHPFDWDEVGYWETVPGGAKREKRLYIPVVQPPNLDPTVIRPKEQELIDLVLREHAEGRQCWVYVDRTGKYDVAERVRQLLKDRGLRVKILRSTVSTAKREQWIADNAPDLDVVVSHPRLVRTGLDLFDKRGGHNFTSLIFYETGYDLFTLRQAARRSWRLLQKLACRVYYMFYEGTMQARAMALMGKKLIASEAIEGKFSSEGLAAMVGDDEGSMEVAMARSLVNRMDDLKADRVWEKVAQTYTKPLEMPKVIPVGPAAPIEPEVSLVDLPPAEPEPVTPATSTTVRVRIPNRQLRMFIQEKRKEKPQHLKECRQLSMLDLDE